MGNEKRPACRIIVLIDGGPTDVPVVETACMLARQSGAKLYLVLPLLVERSLPLDAPLPEATERARVVLEQARSIAAQCGCPAQLRPLRTRDIAAALIDEAADLGCDQIVLGIAGPQRGSRWTIAEQVLRQAPCPVWVFRR